MTRPTLSSASRFVLGLALMSASLSLAACSDMPMPTGYTYQSQVYRAPKGPEVLPVAKLRKVQPTYVAPQESMDPGVSVFPVDPVIEPMPAPMQLTPPPAPIPAPPPVAPGTVKVERRTLVIESVNSRRMNE